MFINDANRDEISKICSSIFVCLDLLLSEDNITTKLAAHMPTNRSLKTNRDIINNIFDLLQHEDFSEVRNNIPKYLQEDRIFCVRHNISNQLAGSETAKKLTCDLIDQLKSCDSEFINEFLQLVNTLDNFSQKACFNLIEGLVDIFRNNDARSESSSDNDHSSEHGSDASHSDDEHKRNHNHRHSHRRNHRHGHGTYGHHTYGHGTYGHGTYGHTYGHGTYGNCTYGNHGHDHCHEHHGHQDGDIHYHFNINITINGNVNFNYNPTSNVCEPSDDTQTQGWFREFQQKLAEAVELLRQNINAVRPSRHSVRFVHHSSTSQSDTHGLVHTIGDGMKSLGNTLWSFGNSIGKATCGRCMSKAATEQPAANEADNEEESAAPASASRMSLAQV